MDQPHAVAAADVLAPVTPDRPASERDARKRRAAGQEDRRPQHGERRHAMAAANPKVQAEHPDRQGEVGLQQGHEARAGQEARRSDHRLWAGTPRQHVLGQQDEN